MEERNRQERGCYPSMMVEAEGMGDPPRVQQKAVEVEGVTQIEPVLRGEAGAGARRTAWGQERRQVEGEEHWMGCLPHYRLSR